jgi:beta-alanine degradation protein BauB
MATPPSTPPTEQVGTRLLFENERVRVWDLALAPGETLEKHIHRTDYCYVVAAGGLIRFADPDNPADYHDIQFADGDVEFIPVGPEGKIDNRLINIGTTPHRNYVIELKGGTS